MPPNYVNGIATANGAKGFAITNYNSILGTQIDDLGPETAYRLKSASLASSNNGPMEFRGKDFNHGFRFADFTDGTAFAPVFCETRERRFASWYDGTMNWVVAARHSNPPEGTIAIRGANKTTDAIVNGQSLTGRWCIGTDGTSATGGVALNYGPTRDHPTLVCLPTAALADPDIGWITPGRVWGASSEHGDGMVNHGFADGHVARINDGIEPNVYLWLVSRNGGEPLGCVGEDEEESPEKR